MSTNSSSCPAPIAPVGPAREATEPVLLVLADISGYTRHMTQHARSLAHAQVIVTELVESILREAELPFEIAKLEGDAVFLYCRMAGAPGEWAAARTLIGRKLLAFFERFRETTAALAGATTCTCTACSNILQLRLKIVVHAGEALFHQVRHFQELAGVDVIIVHRLLKNTVPAAEYLLLTSAAASAIELPPDSRLVRGFETYEGLGRLDTLVYLPEGADQPAGTSSAPGSFGLRFGASWRLFRRMWFAPLRRPAAAPGHQPFPTADAGVSGVARFGFAAATLLLTPFFLPAGLVVAALHSICPHNRKAAPAANPPPPPHAHGPDCGCGHKH